MFKHRLLCLLLLSSVLAACGQDSPEATDKLSIQEAKEIAKQKNDLIARERKVIEKASWFGKTGLSEDVERELPRYIRREFKQTIFDEKSLKADDLIYLGAFAEGKGTVRYWRIKEADRDEARYATVAGTREGGVVMSIGYKLPAAAAK